MQNKSPDNRYVVIRRIYVLNIPPQNLSLMFIKLKRELEKFFFPSSVDVALSRAQQPRNAPLLDNRMLSERRRGKLAQNFPPSPRRANYIIFYSAVRRQQRKFVAD